ncbi:hypothetical protein ROHU_013880 [Labeo rohita]|uniref:Uncharacterized protein n=1 Tax=Labeo rohita TaxID=84645 RepID=A0A498NF18_LABRO|nr:hypothetical protein ROHU_018315 [Labeo rohita]RXN39139.1 hypothetical protein ROHU_013880 [Labeo rohita]
MDGFGVSKVVLKMSHLLPKPLCQLGLRPSSDIKKGLAMALIYEFPCLKDTTGSGYGAWYTPGRKHSPATGFLEERLRNVRKRLRKLKQPGQLTPQDHAITKPESGLPPEKIQEMVDWMKVHKYPVSVEGYMKETAIYRGEWIRSNGSKSIPEILKEFPRLLDNPGMEKNSEIESAVRNLLSCIQKHSNPQAQGNSNSSPTVAPQPGTSASFGVGQAVSRPNTVQQEMQRGQWTNYFSAPRFQGYTAKILKASSNNGKNVIYIVPLQEEIDTTPLPYDAPEFQNMPKNICMTCGTSVPLQLLPCHLEDCKSNNTVESESEKENEEAQGLSHDSDVICLDACPICGEEISAEVMLYHASTCGERKEKNYEITGLKKIGDVATGDGVQRHFLSMAMHKLQNGFLFNAGGSPQTAAITIEDVVDIDIRETIQMLAAGDSKNDFTEDEKATINQLAISWDLPVLKTTNRTWQPTSSSACSADTNLATSKTAQRRIERLNGMAVTGGPTGCGICGFSKTING